LEFITKNILILVKTYPSLSKKYKELVCTAGMDEDGNWYRLYPIPFRMLTEDKRYEKYRWINVKLLKNSEDCRVESYKVIDYKNIKLLEKIDSNDWGRKSKVVLKQQESLDLDELITRSKEQNISLAVFKPTKILDFIWEKDDREYSKDKLDAIKAEKNQLNLFTDDVENMEDFTVIPKLPYKFSYVFEDIKGKKSTLMIEDWEVGAAYWNFLKHYKNEETTLNKIREKFFDDFVKKKNLYFFLGTTKQYHGWAKNPFIIIGVFPLPLAVQNSLF